jgi:hypothetical protein
VERQGFFNRDWAGVCRGGSSDLEIDDEGHLLKVLRETGDDWPEPNLRIGIFNRLH